MTAVRKADGTPKPRHGLPPPVDMRGWLAAAPKPAASPTVPRPLKPVPAAPAPAVALPEPPKAPPGRPKPKGRLPAPSPGRALAEAVWAFLQAEGGWWSTPGLRQALPPMLPVPEPRDVWLTLAALFEAGGIERKPDPDRPRAFLYRAL